MLYLGRAVVLSIFISLTVNFLALNSTQAQKRAQFKPKKQFKYAGIICAKATLKQAYSPGYFVKPRRFEPYYSTIKYTKAQIKKTKNSKKKASLRKTLKNLEAKRERGWFCKLGRKPDLRSLKASFTGSGVAPIAATIKVVDAAPKIAVTFDITGNISDKFKITQFNNGQLLITPLSHRLVTTEFSVRPKQTIAGKTVRGKSSKVSVAWNQGGDFIGDQYSLVPYKTSLSPNEARFFLKSNVLGDLSAENILLATSNNGLDLLIDKLLTPRAANCAAIEAEALRVAGLEFNSVCSSITINDGGIERTPNFCSSSSDTKTYGRWRSEAAVAYFLHMMRFGCEPLKERMALFWANHFSLNFSRFAGTTRDEYIKIHLDHIRSKNAASNQLFTPFKTLISKMHGVDGAMLNTLDNVNNFYSNFGNENYARELLELFTLGVKDAVTGATNYTEDDVYASAFAVMGWTEDYVDQYTLAMTCNALTDAACAALSNPALRTQIVTTKKHTPAFRDNRWNHPTRPTRQVFFSNTPFSTYEAYKTNTLVVGGDTFTSYLVDKHPGVARYLATKLITTFASVEPTDEMVETVANDLRSADFAFEPALKRILISSAVFSTPNQRGVISPTLSIVSFIRALNLPLARSEPGVSPSYNLYQTVSDALSGMGQPLFQPASIFGFRELGKINGGKIFRGGEAWLSSQQLLGRANGFNQYLNALNANKAALAFSWGHLLPPNPALHRDPQAIVNNIIEKLGIQITQEKKTRLVEYMRQIALRQITVQGVGNPDSNFVRRIKWGELDQTQLNNLIDLKIPGLLSLIWQLKETHNY
jgi:uncharacterized protein (DUF1800 family)